MTLELLSVNFDGLMRKDVVIIGAGVVGSAVAYELSRRGVKDIAVLDVDLEGGFSSSERNAGGVRHLWQQRLNSELSRISIAFFKDIASEIGFQEKGYLWLYSNEQKAQGEKVLAHTKERKLAYEALEVAEIKKRYPFIDKTDDLSFALYGEKDGILNTNALKEYFRKNATHAKFYDGLWASHLKSEGGKVSFTAHAVAKTAVETQVTHPEKEPSSVADRWECEKLIIATGAWSGELLKDHYPTPLTYPVRRQISFFKLEDFDLSPYGMVVDTSRVYFHPEGGNVLSGIVLRDEKPGYKFNYDDDFFESHIWPNLYERSSKFERLKPLSGWGGLYSYSPDITGILGPVPKLPNVYEAHSFTGHGVMHSYAAGKLLAEKILDGKYLSLDAEPLSRERFSRGESDWLKEDLHI